MIREVVSRRALDIPELLSLILHELGDPQEEEGVGSDLVMCSTVCKVWSESAIPIIWNSCPSAVLGLFKLLDAMEVQQGVWTYSSSGSVTTKLKTAPRFIHYMHKMRTVNFGLRCESPMGRPPPFTYLHPSAVRTAAFVMEAHGTTLFPFLKNLDVIICETETTEVLVHILHERLVRFSVTWWGRASSVNAPDLCATLLRLQRVCLNIRYLHFDFHITEKASAFLHPHIALVISAMTKLTGLSLPARLVAPTLWEALQGTPVDRLGLSYDFPVHTMPPPTSLPPSLDTLEISLDYTELFQFLSMPTSGSLTALQLIVRNVVCDDRLSGLFKGVTTMMPHLTSLAVALIGNTSLPKPAWFRPLKKLHSLASLDLYLDGFGSFDDSHYQSMVEACPCLVNLSCRPVHPEQLSSQATLRTLSTIADHCPSIQTIAISLDCTLRPENPATWTSFSSSIRSLDMVHSRISNSAHVAGVMCHLFRGLGVTVTATNAQFVSHRPLYAIDRDTREYYRELWREVNSTLKHFYEASISRQVHIACDREVERLRIENEELRAKVSMLELTASRGDGGRTDAVSQSLADENGVGSTIAFVKARQGQSPSP